MKKKSFFIIGILALFSFVFVLSGCDDILEALYPDFTEKMKGGSNEIIIEVKVGMELLGKGDAHIFGKVIDVNDPDFFIQQDSNISQWETDDQGNVIGGKVTFDFVGIPEGKSEDNPNVYKVLIWLELNDNDFPEGDEPQTYAKMYTDTGEAWDTFMFPNPMGWSTVSGDAFLGGKVENMNFTVIGDFALPEAPGKVWYDIWADDSDRKISWIDYEVWDYYLSFDGADPSEYELGGYYELNSNMGAFEVDFGSLGWGKYTLKIIVNYEDGSSARKKFPLLVGSEALEGTSYDLNVVIYGVTGEPLRLDPNKSYHYQFELLDQYGDVLSEPYDFNEMPDTYGDVGINFNFGDGYHNSDYNLGNYLVRISITGDDNDDIPTFVTTVPIVMEDNSNMAPVWVESWDFYPVPSQQ